MAGTMAAAKLRPVIDWASRNQGALAAEWNRLNGEGP
jgi:hypothetical protein